MPTVDWAVDTGSVYEILVLHTAKVSFYQGVLNAPNIYVSCGKSKHQAQTVSQSSPCTVGLFVQVRSEAALHVITT